MERPLNDPSCLHPELAGDMYGTLFDGRGRWLFNALIYHNHCANFKMACLHACGQVGSGSPRSCWISVSVYSSGRP